MKKFLLGAVSLIVLGAAPAFAADLPARAYTKAPVLANPIADWSGFYLGGDVGWAGARQTGTAAALPAGFGAPAIPGGGLAGFGILPVDFGSLNSNGFTGGVYGGYNWQAGHSVFGVEGDFSYLDRSSSSTPQALFSTFGATTAIGGASLQLTTSAHWLASVRGRIGYAWDKAMVYATGGAAFTHVNYNQNLVAGVLTGIVGLPPTSSVGFSQDKVGYAAGVGVEWMMATNWLLRLEYLHYGFQGSSGALPVVAGSCTAAVNCRFVASTSDLNLDTVRVGLSYKFGGPVVARY
jgi:outer membrane immunogenic protein